MITINKRDAIRLLRQVVKGKESFVYNTTGVGTCEYVNKETGKPSCLVGHALRAAGVRPVQLSRMDDPPVMGGYVQNTAIDSVELPKTLHLTPAAITVFAAAQSAQDTGESWGEALAKAEAAPTA